MKSNFRNFIISTAFFRVAFDLMGIYGIISYYLIFGHSFLYAFGIYAVMYFLNSLLVRPAMEISSRIGTRNAMILAICCFILSFFPLSQIPSKDLLFVGLWIIFSAAGRSLFFTSQQYFVSKLTDEKTRGRKLGGLNAISILFSIMTPFIGGYVSEFYGLPGLALVMAFFFILAAFPLFRIPNYKFQVAGKVSKIFFSRDTLKITKVIVINELQTKDTIWDIYVFILLGSSFAYFANVATVVAIITIMATFVIGRTLDHHNRKHVLQFDSLINSGLWFLRSLVSTVAGILFVDSIFKINAEVRVETIDTLTYDLLAKKNQEQLFDEKIIAKEIWTTFLIGLNLMLSFFLVNFFGFQAAFIFAGLTSLFFWLL